MKPICGKTFPTCLPCMMDPGHSEPCIFREADCMAVFRGDYDATRCKEPLVLKKDGKIGHKGRHWGHVTAYKKGKPFNKLVRWTGATGGDYV
jgi:hypothetical protein